MRRGKARAGERPVSGKRTRNSPGDYFGSGPTADISQHFMFAVAKPILTPIKVRDAGLNAPGDYSTLHQPWMARGPY